MSAKNKITKDGNIVTIRSGSKKHRIPMLEIFYIESDDRRIVVNTISSSVMCYQKISEIETILGASFYRCHRSYIVNLEHVREYSNSFIRLKNRIKVPLSRRKCKEFKEKLSSYNDITE